MFIKIASTYCRVIYREGMFTVECPTGERCQALALKGLFDEVKSKFSDVVIPDEPYTKDLSVAEFLVKDGFKYCGHRRVKTDKEDALLRPDSSSPSRMKDLPEEKKGEFRFYELRWIDRKGKERSKRLTEIEVDMYRLVDQTEEPITG